MAIFDDRAASLRLQEAASAWQQNDPRFKQLLDIVSQALYTRSASALAPADNRLLSMFTAAAQNSFPGVLGNPIPGLISVNRALTAGAIPITAVDNATGKLQTSYSYGTGNVSTTAAASILRSFELGLTTNGRVDLTKTHGVDADLRSQLVASIVAERGVRPGDFRTYDLSYATNSEKLGHMITYMRRGYADESSLKSAKEAQEAMRYFERHSGLRPDQYENMASYELEATITGHLKGLFDDSTIKRVITLMQGKATSFQVQQKHLNEEITKAYDGIAENFKELSALFQTNDINAIKNYAKGLGMGNVVDSSKAHIVKAQMQEIAAISNMTGRSPQEIAAERMQISSGLSTIYGGRPAPHAAISRVQLAGGGDRDEAVYTKENSQSSAAISEANRHNMEQGIIMADALFGSGRLSSDQILEYNEFQERLKKATTTDERHDLSLEIGAWTERVAGSEFINREETRAWANKNYSEKSHSGYVNALARENIQTNVKNYLADGNNLIYQDTAAEDLYTLFTVFGNDTTNMTKFLSAEGTQEMQEMLLKRGMKPEQATAFANNILTRSNELLPLVSRTFDAPWAQQYGRMNTDQVAKNTDFANRLLNKQNNLVTADEGAFQSMIAGFTSTGSISAKNMASWKAAEVIEKAEYNDEDVDKALAGVGAFRLGTINEHTKQVELDEEQRKRMKRIFKLNGPEADAKLDAMLKDTATFMTELESAGYILAENAFADDGRSLVAMKERNAELYAKEANTRFEQAGLGTARALGDVTFQTSRGNFSVTVGGQTFGSGKSAVRSSAVPEQAVSNLAKEGDTFAQKSMSDKYKANLRDLKNKGKALNSDAVKRIDALLAKETVTSGDFEAIWQYLAPEGWAAYRSTAGMDQAGLTKKIDSILPWKDNNRELVTTVLLGTGTDDIDEEDLEKRLKPLEPILSEAETLVTGAPSMPNTDNPKQMVQILKQILNTLNGTEGTGVKVSPPSVGN